MASALCPLCADIAGGVIVCASAAVLFAAASCAARCCHRLRRVRHTHTPKTTPREPEEARARVGCASSSPPTPPVSRPVARHGGDPAGPRPHTSPTPALMARRKARVRKKAAAAAKPKKAPKKPTAKAVQKSIDIVQEQLGSLDASRRAWVPKNDVDTAAVFPPAQASERYTNFFTEGAVDVHRGKDSLAAAEAGKPVPHSAATGAPPVRDAYVSAIEASRRADADVIAADDAMEVPTPAFVSYSVMRRQVWARRMAVDAATGASMRATLQAQLVKLETRLKKLRAKEVLALGGTLDSGDATAPATLPPVVGMTVEAMMMFLARAVRSNPELCYEPLEHIATMLGGFAPQVRGLSAAASVVRLRLCCTVASVPAPPGVETHHVPLPCSRWVTTTKCSQPSPQASRRASTWTTRALASLCPRMPLTAPWVTSAPWPRKHW